MHYYMIVEPLVKNAFWSNQYIEGIKHETQRVRGTFVEVGLDETDIILKGARAECLRPVVILNCISRTWIMDSIEMLAKKGIHPLLLAPFDYPPSANVSAVSLDFTRAFYNLCRYLAGIGREKIAFFGINPISANDARKIEAFAKFKGHTDKGAPPDGIFFNRGSLENICQKFWEEKENYNSVICSNDVIAIKLINFLKRQGMNLPEDMYIASMGNTKLAGLIRPSVTVSGFDCFAIGRKAVGFYTALARDEQISSLSATISSSILVRESTGNLEPPALPDPEFPVEQIEPINFYSDEDVKRIFALERLVANLDKLDCGILEGIIFGKKIKDISSQFCTTENTVKYRIKRMQKLAGVSSRAELISLLGEYFDYL